MDADRAARGPVAVLGAGAAATALAQALSRAGVQLRVSARRPGAAQELARALEGVHEASDLEGALRDARVVLLCVADRALAEVAAAAARELPADGSPPVALHVSGHHGRDVLEPLARAGCATGRWHPLAPLAPSGTAAAELSGVWFGTSGEGEALEVARTWTELLGGHELPLGEGPVERAAYHAAAVLVSGGSVALLDVAREVLERGCGLEAPAARRALAALLRETARNLEQADPADVLTGPAARGEAALVADHLRALSELERAGALSGAASALYRELTRRMVRLVERRGGVGAEQVSDVERLLGEDGRP